MLRLRTAVSVLLRLGLARSRTSGGAACLCSPACWKRGPTPRALGKPTVFSAFGGVVPRPLSIPKLVPLLICKRTSHLQVVQDAEVGENASFARWLSF